MGAAVGDCVGNGVSSTAGAKVIAASGEAAEEAGNLSVGVATGSTKPLLEDSTELAACSVGMDWPGDSAITSGNVARGAGRQPSKSPLSRIIPAPIEKGIRTTRCRLLRSRFDICNPAKLINFERPFAARGEVSVFFYAAGNVREFFTICAEQDAVAFLTFSFLLI